MCGKIVFRCESVRFIEEGSSNNLKRKEEENYVIKGGNEKVVGNSII